jgi:hypothetical protein
VQPKGQPTRARRSPGFSLAVEHLVPVSLALVAVHLLFRAWALSENWFFYDDYYLIQEGSSPSALSHLFDPYNGHLMPGARVIAWALAGNGGLNWTLACAVTLLIQAVAAGGALWMLLTLFGRRWGVLVPLTLYLTTAFTMPSMIWWSVAITALPTQVAFFWSVGSFVRYLRTREWSWLGYAIGAVAFGLAFDVRGILVVPVLVFLAVAYFARGNVVRRVASLGRIWPAVAIGGGISVAYVAAYRIHVPQPFNESSWRILREMADNMVATAFPTALVGGPWRWDDDLLIASPPQWAVQASWVAVLGVPLYAFLRRERTLRAWMPTVFLLLTILALVSLSRAPVLGAELGLDYRFFAEVSCAVVLGGGLAFMEVKGATESSAARPSPLLSVAPPPRVAVGLALAVTASAIYSSADYALKFHAKNDSHAYFDTAVADIERVGNIDLVNQQLPPTVMDLLFHPRNTTGQLLPMMTDHARFPQSAPTLAMFNDSGDLRSVNVGSGVISKDGRDKGCGWRITDKGRTIPLTAAAFDFSWWLHIGYLSSSDSPVRISAGDAKVDTMVMTGLNDLFVHVDAGFDTIRFDGLASDTAVCVDRIEVGLPEPGEPR